MTTFVIILIIILSLVFGIKKIIKDKLLTRCFGCSDSCESCRYCKINKK